MLAEMRCDFGVAAVYDYLACITNLQDYLDFTMLRRQEDTVAPDIGS